MSPAYAALVDALSDLSVREIARRSSCTLRAADNWKSGENGPSWRHVCTMMADPIMRPRILKAIENTGDVRLDEIRRLGT